MTENKIVEAFLKGFNKPLILCLKPTYGYNLIKEFKRITGRELKPQRVYPFLYFLEEKDYITSTWMNRGKRRIRNYEVTQKSKALLSSVKMHLNSFMGKMLLDILFTDGKNR